MIHYQVTMRHTEKTFENLAHMQYDLFCQKNLVVRSIISFAAMVAGVVNFSQWWGVLLILYGSYMTSSKYAQANHTAHKMVKGIEDAGLDFPVSRYLFRENAMEVISMPENTTLGEPLLYADIEKLGEDDGYFYLFKDQYGGYMIPKKELGKSEEAFRIFIEGKTKKTAQSHFAPIVKILRWAQTNKRKKSE